MKLPLFYLTTASDIGESTASTPCQYVANMITAVDNVPSGPDSSSSLWANWNTQLYFESVVLEDIAMCLAAGANPNAENEAGLTHLHIVAAIFKGPAAGRLLVASGANPNKRDGSGNAPLAWAAWDENPSAVKALIHAGADPNA